MTTKFLILKWGFQVTGLLAIAACVALAMAWGFGPPPPSGYSSLPTVFFLSGFPMIATGASLAYALNFGDPRRIHSRLLLPKFLGAIFLGWQSYATWCLSQVQIEKGSGGFFVVILMVVAHLLSALSIYVLLIFASIQLEARTEKSPDRFLIMVCSVSWYLLGMAWIGLLCLFATLV